MIKNFIDKYLVLLSSLAVFLCFIPLFYFSTKFMVNNWAYADALINYSEGFVRRGFLGEILLFTYKVTNIELSKIYSYFFIIITFTNIIFFILILKNVSKSRFVYLFLLINPVLLFFPLHDTLAYMRKEMIMLTLMLFHCYICNNYHNKKIHKKKYLKFLYLIIIPGIMVSTLMHDMQVFLVPFHFLLSVNVLNKNLKLFNPKNYFEKVNLTLTPYLITLLPIIIFQFYPTDIEKLKIMAEKLSAIEPNLWWDGIRFTANPFFNAVIEESKFMFSVDKMGTYNHLFKYSFLLFLSLISIIFIFKVVLKKNIKIFNNHFLYFSILPIFLLFFIGRDGGRWINMISWTCLLFYLQFNINIKNSYFFIFKKNILLNIMIVSLSCYYLFFLFLPHCCKGQRIDGGFSSNIKLAYQLIFEDSNHLNKIFRKHGKGYESN